MYCHRRARRFGMEITVYSTQYSTAQYLIVSGKLIADDYVKTKLISMATNNEHNTWPQVLCVAACL